MRKTLIFLALVSIQSFACSPLLAQDHQVLNGYIEVQDRPEAIRQLVRQEPQLDNSLTPDENKPVWIANAVYSNPTMKMRVWKKILGCIEKADLPRGMKSQLTIKDRVLSFWRGSIPGYPCKVTCVPYGPEGNYKFFAKAGGPRGYLQNMGRDENGFATYKYWFEYPQYILHI